MWEGVDSVISLLDLRHKMKLNEPGRSTSWQQAKLFWPYSRLLKGENLGHFWPANVVYGHCFCDFAPRNK